MSDSEKIGATKCKPHWSLHKLYKKPFSLSRTVTHTKLQTYEHMHINTHLHSHIQFAHSQAQIQLYASMLVL